MGGAGGRGVAPVELAKAALEEAAPEAPHGLVLMVDELVNVLPLKICGTASGSHVHPVN